MTQPNIDQDLEKLLASAHTLQHALFNRKDEMRKRLGKFERDKLEFGSELEVFTNQLTYTIAQLILLESTPSKKLESLGKLTALFEELLPESRSDWKKAHKMKTWVEKIIQEFSPNKQQGNSQGDKDPYQSFLPP